MASDSIAVAAPFTDLPCQDLIFDGTISHSGWLRKRTKLAQGLSKFRFNFFNKFQKKFIPWLHKYVVVSQGCLYCYNSERARSPSSAFSLYGYTRVARAGPEIYKEEATWVFKLIHIYEQRTYWFSASSEAEMKVWMKKIRKEIKSASCLIHSKETKKSSSSSAPEDSDDSEDDYSIIEEPVIDPKLAAKFATKIGKIDEKEETSDQEEEQYMEIDKVEAARQGINDRTHKLRNAADGHKPPKKDKLFPKKSVPLPPESGSDDQDRDIPTYTPPPPPHKGKRAMKKPHSSGEEEDENVYDDENVCSPGSMKVGRPPPDLPDNQEPDSNLNYDDVEPKDKPRGPFANKKFGKPPPALPKMPSSPTEDRPSPRPVLSPKSRASKNPTDNRPPVAAKKYIPPGAVSVMPSLASNRVTKTLPNRPNPAPRTDIKGKKGATLPSHLSPVQDGVEYEETEFSSAKRDEYAMAYFDGSNADEGLKILVNTKEIGAYMVRPSFNQGTDKLTLVVLVGQNETKKYKIQQKQNSKYFLQKDTEFEDVLGLLRHYQKENLPTCALKLGRPYKLIQDED